MTEKQFKIKLSDIGELINCDTQSILAVSSIAEELIPLCDLLNELNDENKELKQENEQLKKDLEHCANQFTNDGKNVLLSLR